MDDSDDIGLESISEPELDQDGTGEDDWSPSPLSGPGESVPSLSVPSNQQDDTENFDNPDVIVEDDDDIDGEGGWIEPSVPQIPPYPTPTSASALVSFNTSPGKTRNKAPVPTVVQHFPFPSSSSSDVQDTNSADIVRVEARSKSSIRNARARDGGRTQSGGIKGIYIDSGDET